MPENNTRRRTFIKSAGAASVVALAGCTQNGDGSDGATTGTADGSLSLTSIDVLLTYFPDMVFSPMTGADEFGYFEDVGLEVNITSNLAIQNPLQILVGGEADVVVATPFSYVTALARGIPVKNLFTTIGSTPMSYVTTGDSGIESVSDWGGNTLGLQNEADRNWVTPVVLEEEGVSQEDLTQTYVGYSVTNVTEGNVDILSLYPTNSDYNSLRLQGTEFNVFEARDYTNAPGNCALTSESLAEQHPETFEAFTRAWAKSCEESLQTSNRDRFAQLALDRLNAADADVFLGDVDPLEVERSNFDQFQRFRPDDTWESNGVGYNDAADYAEVQGLGVRSGAISEDATTAEADIVDNRFVEAVTTDGQVDWPY
jgi:NitT/TauT family transport system substrate-binding protein